MRKILGFWKKVSSANEINRDIISTLIAEVPKLTGLTLHKIL